MTDAGDDTAEALRRQPVPPPASAQIPTQEIRRRPIGDNPQRLEETGRMFPVPPAASAPSGPGAGTVGGSTAAPYPPGPVAASRTAPDPSESDRARALRAQQKAAARAARKAAARRPRQTRRAKLRLTRVDPWSVTKTAFLLSIAFGVMCVVAVFLIFSIMSASGLWDKVNETIQSVVNQDPTNQFNIKDYVAMSRVMGITMLISVIDVVLITALATLGAFIYNLSAAMLGGVEVTLAEDLD